MHRMLPEGMEASFEQIQKCRGFSCYFFVVLSYLLLVPGHRDRLAVYACRNTLHKTDRLC